MPLRARLEKLLYAKKMCRKIQCHACFHCTRVKMYCVFGVLHSITYCAMQKWICTYTQRQMLIYIYIMCVCVCVCMTNMPARQQTSAKQQGNYAVIRPCEKANLKSVLTCFNHVQSHHSCVPGLCGLECGRSLTTKSFPNKVEAGQTAQRRARRALHAGTGGRCFAPLV